MQHSMRTAALAAAVAALGLTGCATTKPMALSKELQTVPLDAQQSLALATVKVANVYKTGAQPHAQNVRVKAAGENGETFAFQVGKPFKANADEANQFEEFLVSLALGPGEYTLEGLFVSARVFISPGSGMVPVNSTFKVPPGKAIYLGRIEALRRERVGDEPRAGSVIPLLDQAVTGFSGGTFDVKLLDAYDQDLQVLRAEFPALQKVEVEKALLVLPPKAAPAAPAAAPAAAPVAAPVAPAGAQ